MVHGVPISSLMSEVNHMMHFSIHHYNMQLYILCSPFCSTILTTERILELNDHPTILLQGTWVLHVVPNQLPESRKLLIPVQVIVVTCILDLDMKYLIEMPKLGNKVKRRETGLLTTSRRS